MSSAQTRPTDVSAPFVLRLAEIKRLLWQGPARILVSILLVLIASALYGVFPIFRTNSILYICVLLALFVCSVSGFEIAIGRAAKLVSLTDDGNEGECNIELSNAPSYSREELKTLVTSLQNHLAAVNEQYPSLFEKFHAAAQQRVILFIVQNPDSKVVLEAELLKKAFHDFGFKVMIKSHETSSRLTDLAAHADLVLYDSRVANYSADDLDEHRIGRAPLCMMSVI